MHAGDEVVTVTDLVQKHVRMLGDYIVARVYLHPEASFGLVRRGRVDDKRRLKKEVEFIDKQTTTSVGEKSVLKLTSGGISEVSVF